MAIIKKSVSSGEDVEKLECSYISGGNIKIVQPLWKMIWKFLKKLNMELPPDPTIMGLGKSSRKGKICPCRNVYTNFYSSIFIIAKMSKQFKCPSGDE